MNAMDTPRHPGPIYVQEYGGSKCKIRQTAGYSFSEAAHRHA